MQRREVRLVQAGSRFATLIGCRLGFEPLLAPPLAGKGLADGALQSVHPPGASAIHYTKLHTILGPKGDPGCDLRLSRIHRCKTETAQQSRHAQDRFDQR